MSTLQPVADLAGSTLSLATGVGEADAAHRAAVEAHAEPYRAIPLEEVRYATNPEHVASGYYARRERLDSLTSTYGERTMLGSACAGVLTPVGLVFSETVAYAGLVVCVAGMAQAFIPAAIVGVRSRLRHGKASVLLPRRATKAWEDFIEARDQIRSLNPSDDVVEALVEQSETMISSARMLAALMTERTKSRKGPAQTISPAEMALMDRVVLIAAETRHVAALSKERHGLAETASAELNRLLSEPRSPALANAAASVQEEIVEIRRVLGDDPHPARAG